MDSEDGRLFVKARLHPSPSRTTTSVVRASIRNLRLCSIECEAQALANMLTRYRPWLPLSELTKKH